MPLVKARYTLILLHDLKTIFPWITAPDPEPPPRYNIAPTQQVLAATNDVTGSRAKFDFLHWGLIPPWAKEPTVGNWLINARAETLAEKPTFRDAFRRRRCLIPADGFYEWRKNPDGSKSPMYVRLKTHEPLRLRRAVGGVASEDGRADPLLHHRHDGAQ